MKSDKDEEPELRCPFCGSPTRQIRPQSARMIRLFATADATSVVMHDLALRLEAVAWAIQGIRHALEESQTPLSKRLLDEVERAERSEEAAVALIKTLREMYRPGEYGVKPVAKLPDEVSRICKWARYSPQIDFTSLSTSPVSINFDDYLDLFFVALNDVLISLSRDRRPGLGISLNISGSVLRTSFRIRHSGQLYDRSEPLWYKLQWSVKLAKGRFWLSNEDKEVTVLAWELPVVE